TGDRDAVDRSLSRARLRGVEGPHDQSAPRRSTQSRCDAARMGACAYDDDVPQVSSAPAQGSKDKAQRSTRDEMGDEAPQYPRQRPAARKFDTGLGEEQKSAADHADQEPGQDERAEFFEETDAALRLIKSERREDGEREQP